ncbi:MAG: peptidoglycan-associated lipoprotein Pal [Casimicrobium sp.]
MQSRLSPRKLLAHAVMLSCVTLLVACGSTPEQAAKVEDRSTGTPPPSTQGLTPGASTTPGAVTSAGTVGQNTGADGLDPALKDPRSPLSKRSIFFDYDSFTVKDEYKVTVEAHAAYLKRTPKARIVVEGNTDERGSREYNLALGQKRSEAVKRVMALLGVSDSQIETVSFGEEKPRNSAQSEQAFAENRRADIRYVGE